MLSKFAAKTSRNWFLRSVPLAVVVLSIVAFVMVRGPAAYGQDDDGVPAPGKARVVKKTAKKLAPRTAPKKTVLKATRKKAAPKSNAVKKSNSSADEDEPSGDSTDQTESFVTEERDPVRRGSNARELAVRVVGLGKISVLPIARNYVPRDLEARLAERLVQDLAAKTYFEPQALDGAFDMRTGASTLAGASKKALTDGVLVFQIGLEQIQGYLAAASGRRIRTFDLKYRVGELEEKNAVSILSDRMIEDVVRAIPYRGFVTASEKTGTATVNLGTNHSVKEGDILELFEFRRPNFNSTHKLLMEVRVAKVLGPSESQVELLEGASKSTRIEPYSKVSFSLAKTATVSATDHSVVAGRWWWGFGGELDSFGAEAAAPKYESRIFKINGAPFGYLAGGNDVLTIRGAFGSGRSDVETLSFFDVQGTYAIYQLGGAQSAWTIGAGGRVFMVTVSPNPGATSALESTTLVSPMAEVKYQYVPRGRIRLVGTGEVFWPMYTTGAQASALLFAFGGGAGFAMQIAITSKFGAEVFGKLRYLRRPIDGQSGVQERQSMVGAGLLFSF